MKEKITTVLLFFSTLAMVILISAFAYKIYFYYIGINEKQMVSNVQDIFVEEFVSKREKIKNTISPELTEIIDESTEEKQKSEKNDNNTNNSINRFFYNQLEKNEKIIYDGLYSNKKNLMQGTYVINYGDVFTEMLKTENGSDKLGDMYQAAVEAFTHDNPDVFYIDVNKMYLNIESSTRFFMTSYNVYISAGTEDNYLSKDFRSSIEIEEINNSIEKVKDNIKVHMGEDDYKNILYIHDYLINNIQYDSSYEAAR